MIVWINGAHGAGKTKVAQALVRRASRGHLIDPEQVGFMLRKVWPGPRPDDFKDLPVWRSLTVELLSEAARRFPHHLLVVPMTLSDPDAFDQMVGGLRRRGLEVAHFTLTAPVPVLRQRLRRRLDWPSSRKWASARTAAAAAALQDERFAVHVETDGRSVADVAATLMAMLPPPR